MNARYSVILILWTVLFYWADTTAFFLHSVVPFRVARSGRNAKRSIRILQPCSSPLFASINDKTVDSDNSNNSTASTTTSRQQRHHNKQQLLDDLRLDFDRLAAARPPVSAADDSLSPVLVSAGSSYTRLWTHSTWRAHSRPPHVRYARHVTRWWSSSTARVILPAVSLATVYAATLCIVCRRFGWTGTVLAGLGSTSVLSILSAPLALLLTLRANASMTRLLDSRLQAGRMVLHARGLANLLRIYLFDSNPYICTTAIRHLATLPWIFKAALRGESRERDLEVLSIMLTDSIDYEWAIAQNKLPIALTCRLRQLCCTALQQSPYSDAGVGLMIEERIRELETVYGACQRILTSPIPPTYSRHLSRVLAVWLLVTPLSLIASGLPTITVALTTTLGAYVLIGIDEVGMEIENAFALLPLQQLCGSTQNDIRDAFLTEMPELFSDES